MSVQEDRYDAAVDHEHELCGEAHPAGVLGPDGDLALAHCGECGARMPHEQHLRDGLLEGDCPGCEKVYEAQEARRNSSY